MMDRVAGLDALAVMASCPWQKPPPPAPTHMHTSTHTHTHVHTNTPLVVRSR